MSSENKQYLDINSSLLSVGDNVKLLKASKDLLRGLPKSDQDAIKDQVNKILLIESFDDYGHVEIEFTSSDGHIHSIWVDPGDLEKT